jgi:methyl-accepting chemotaxis protein
MEGTQRRIESDKEIIGTIGLQMEMQTDELRGDFNLIKGLANEVLAFTPLIKVISDIAQKIHLLALNAEIEAARAGEFRRSFGVMALEVRKLAQSSTQAARDIGDLINATCARAHRDLAEAQVTFELHEKTDVMAGSLADLAQMQRDFSDNDQTIHAMIVEVEANYQDSVVRLSQALAHIQFQDVMRQRMEHVQGALIEMRDHRLWLSDRPKDSTWAGQLDLSFKSMLASHLNSYSMANQTVTHNSTAGVVAMGGQSRPAIELF